MASDAHPETIGRRTASASVWLITARIGARAIDFVTLLMLAHLLAPADFGIIAIPMVMVQILEAVFEMPTGQVLAREPTITPDLLNTAFTLSLLRGAALAVLLALASFPLTRIYGDARLGPLVCCLSLAPAFRGIVSPRLFLYAKAIDFRRDFAMDVIGKLFGFATAVTLARLTHSYWAIAAGTVATPAMMTVVSFSLAPCRPRLTLARWRDFAAFIGWTSASQAVSALNWQAGRLVLSGLVNRAALGNFSLASDLALIPEQAVIKPILRTLMMGFILVREDAERLRRAYLFSLQGLVWAGTPLMVGLSMLAQPAVRLMLGAHWAAAAPNVEALALILLMPLFSAPMPPLALALGRPEMILRRNLFELALRLPAIIIGAWLGGIGGAILGQAVATAAATLNQMSLVNRLAGIGVAQQLRRCARAGIAGGAMTTVLALMRPLTDGQTGLGLACMVIVCAICGLATYGGALLLLWRCAGQPDGPEDSVLHMLEAWHLSARRLRAKG